MKPRQLMILLAITCAAPLALAQNVKPEAQPAPEPPATDVPEMDMNDPMMQAWLAASTPGEHHKHLEVMAGEWVGTSTMWMMPGADPMVSPVTCSSRMELDGRFLLSNHAGEMMGMPFRGMGTMGYNNTTKKYEGAWMDNMGTMTMFMTGTCSDDGKVFTMRADFVDPMTGQPTYMKELCTIIDQNRYTFEMYGPGPDGAEFMMMKIEYTRADRPMRRDRIHRPDAAPGQRPAGRPANRDGE